MGNVQLARVFWEIADLLELKGENPFKARAYRRAAQRLESLPEDAEALYIAGKLEGIEGIGKAISEKIGELVTTGRLEYYEKLKVEVPEGLIDMLSIPGVGPKTVRALHEALRITNIDALEEAARAKKIRGLPGMGPKTEENIIRGIQVVRGRTDRIPLGVGFPIGLDMVERLRRIREVDRAGLAGSLRRMKDTIGDIDIVVASSSPSEVMDHLEHFPQAREVLARGEVRISLLIREGLRVDVWIVSPNEYWAALHHSTGSQAHNIRLREIAKDMGLKINEYGILVEDTGKQIVIGDEAEIYETLGLMYVPPELREDSGEIEAAKNSTIPELVKVSDIKGDLHVHTSWSDGLASIEEMVREARRKGYSYIAITDHSKSLGVARGLSEEALLRQLEEIRKLNENLKDFRVLAGTEVDIMSDNTLDYSDSVLGQLDLVVASVHTGLRQEGKKITERILAALENGHVDILAHPTGRLLGRRDASLVDIDKVIEVASRTGAILEVNSFPDRLDLSDVNARKAKEHGVKIAINTDSHAPDQFAHMSYGVATARRGWLEREDVVNTWPVERLLELRRL